MAWTLMERALEKLETVEMWIYSRMLRIKWQSQVKNNIRKRIRKKTEIKFCELSYFGHKMSCT